MNALGQNLPLQWHRVVCRPCCSCALSAQLQLVSRYSLGSSGVWDYLHWLPHTGKQGRAPSGKLGQWHRGLGQHDFGKNNGSTLTGGRCMELKWTRWCCWRSLIALKSVVSQATDTSHCLDGTVRILKEEKGGQKKTTVLSFSCRLKER